MKLKQLLAATLLFCSAGAWAQTDVTNTYLTNADFSSMTGWEEYKSGTTLNIGSGLIGSFKPTGNTAATVDATHLNTEYCIGMQNRWNTVASAYRQTTQTLPVGYYELSYDVEDVNSSSVKINYDNLFYVQINGTKYTDSSTEWMAAGKSSWTTHTISFNIEEETTATISLGYGNKENNNVTPIIYVSHLKLTWTDPDAAANAAKLEAAKYSLNGYIKKATAMNAVLSDATLTSAIGTAQGVYDAANDYATHYDGVVSASTTLNSAITTALSSATTIDLENGTFDTTPNNTLNGDGTTTFGGTLSTATSNPDNTKDMSANAGDHAYLYEVTGWTQYSKFNSTASQGTTSEYGTAMPVNGWSTNSTTPPAKDMFGNSTGAALHLSAGWNDQARYQQTIDNLPSGRYLLYYEVINQHSNSGIASNYIGVNGAAGDFYGTTTAFVYSDLKTIEQGVWKAQAFEFDVAKTANINFSVGVTTSTGGSANGAKLWVDNFLVYRIGDILVTEDDANEIIASAEALDNVAFNATDKAALASALEAFQGVENIDNYNALSAALIQANNSVSVYRSLDAAITNAEAWTATSAVEAMRTKYNNGEYANDVTAAGIYAEYQAAEIAALVAAEETNFTSVILNHSFETGNMTGWSALSRTDTGVKDQSNGTYSITNGDAVDGLKLFNSWGGSAENNVYQTIPSLPAGTYQLSALLAGFNGEELVLAANETTNSVVVAGDKTVGYTVNVIFTLDAASDVTIKASNTKGVSTSDASFIKADNFTLTAYSDPLAALKEQLNTLKGEADAALKDEAYANITGAEKSTLNSLSTVDPEETAVAYNEAINAITAAISAFKNAKSSYDAYAIAKAEAEDVNEADVLAVVIAGNAEATAADALAASVILPRAQTNKDANYAAPVATDFVVNGTFDSGISPWQRTGTYQNNQTANNKQGDFTGNFYENWNGSAQVNKMYQTINNIPNGTYRLDIAAFVSILADPNESQYVFANNDKTYLTTGDPTAYEVWTVVTDNTIVVGLDQTTATANWMGIDNVSLRYYGAGNVINDAQNASHKLAWEEAKAAAEAAVANSDYAIVTGSEKTNLQTEIAKAEPTTPGAYDEAAAALNSATATFVAAAPSYTALADEITYAKTIGIATETADSYAATAEFTAAEAVVSMQDLKVAEYAHITTTYTQTATIGSWTENFAEDLNGEGYVSEGVTYFNEWGTNTRTAKQTLTLPAGDYAISVIERGQQGTSGYMYYKIGENETKVPFLMKGNRGRGVDTTGAANFSEEGTYTCNNEGFGWEYRFLTFHLDESTEVEVGISATFAGAWVSIYAPKVLTTEASVKALRLSEISTALSNVPDEKMNATVQSTLNSKVSAAEGATDSNTIDELETILEELNEAIEAANASVAVYEKIKAALDLVGVYTYKGDLIEIEGPYNDGTYTNETPADIYAGFQRIEGEYLVENGVEDVTLNGVNFTNLIINPSFETGDMTGWEAASRTDVGVKRQDNETYSITSGAPVDGDYLFNSWGGNAENNVYQTIYLPAGTYILSAVMAGFKDEILLLSAGREGQEAGSGIIVTGDKTVGYENKLRFTLEEDGNVTIKAYNTKRGDVDASFFKVDNFRLTRLTTTTDYTNLNIAIENAEVDHTLGFEKGEYAPYNNVKALQLLTGAKAIDQEKPYVAYELDALVDALTYATWTVNEDDVDAIYNGMFATVTEGANYPEGWARTNAWGQMRTGIEGDFETAYYNQPGSLKYGETGVYTMPLAANTAYQLSFSYRSHENNSNKGVTVSVLNGEGQGMEAQTFSGNGSTSNWTEARAYFTTGDAGNYVLTLANNGNTWMTNVSLVKAASAALALNEGTTFEPINRTFYETVTLTRTVKEGYNTVCLPFDLTAEQVAEVFGTEAKVYTFSENSVDADNATINFDEKEGNTIAANVPVLIGGATATTEETKVKTINGVIFKSSEAVVAGTNFDFVGTYEASTDIPENDYFIGKGAIYRSAGATTIKAFRAYIHDKTGNSEVKFFVNGEAFDLATAIREMNGNVIENSAIYNISGQRVNKAQKGIYIVNGKKVVIK